MPKRQGSAEPPLLCQRRFEPSRVEQRFWCEAYEHLVPEGRRAQASRPAAVSCPGSQEQAVSLLLDSVEVHCA